MNECPQGTCDAVEHIKENMVTKAGVRWAVGIVVLFVLALGGVAIDKSSEAIKERTIATAERTTNKNHYEFLEKEIKSQGKDIDQLNTKIDKILLFLRSNRSGR